MTWKWHVPPSPHSDSSERVTGYHKFLWRQGRKSWSSYGRKLLEALMTTKNSFYHILSILNTELKSFFCCFSNRAQLEGSGLFFSFVLTSCSIYWPLSDWHIVYVIIVCICVLCPPRPELMSFFLKAIQPQLRAHNRYLIAYLGIDIDSTQQIMSTQYISVDKCIQCSEWP